MADYYARFQNSSGQWFPGDHVRNGQQWITLNGWRASYSVIYRSPSSRGAAGTSVGGMVLLVRGLTAAVNFASASLTGQHLPVAEIEAVEVVGGREIQFLVIRISDVIVTGLTRGSNPNQNPSIEQQVQVDYAKIHYTYIPVPTQPSLSAELSRLGR